MSQSEGSRRRKVTKEIEITCRDEEGVMIRLPLKPDGKRPGRRKVRVIVERDVLVLPANRRKRPDSR